MTTYSTGNPIGSTDPRDLYDNAENLDEAVNTRTAESWDDRFGVARKTWWGMEQDFQQFLLDSGYVNIGDYGPGLEITARNQIFWRDGELYRAGAALELPYTTTGDWGAEEGLFVAVGDQSLRQELSSPSGSSLIGFNSSNVYNELEKISGLFVTPQMFGAIGDGVEDDTESMQMFAASPVSNKYIPAGEYLVHEPLIFNPGDMVHGDGSSSLIITSDGFAGGNIVSVSGTLEELPPMVGDIPRGAAAFDLANGANLVAGDIVILYVPQDFSFSPYRAYYRAGEMMVVDDQVGNTVNIFGKTYDPYTASGSNMYKLVGDQVVFKDFKIEASSASSCGLKISLIQNPRVENVTVSGSATEAAIYLDRCHNIYCNTNSLQNVLGGGSNYGILIGNSQGGEVHGSYYGTRHGVAFGGTGDAIAVIPNRDITVTADAYCSGDSQAMNLHGNAENITIVGGYFDHGINPSGRNNRYINCHIKGDPTLGVTVYAVELIGGYQILDGCIIDPGFTDVYAPFFLPGFEESRGGAVQFFIRNCTVVVPSGATEIFNFSNSSDISVSVNIDQLTLMGNISGLTNILRLSSISSSFGTVRLDGLYHSEDFTPGMSYVSLSGSPSVYKYVLPEQSGATTVNITSGGSAWATPVVFPIRYPKIPNTTATAILPQAGGKNMVVGADSPTVSGFGAWIGTVDGSNTTGAGFVSVVWRAKVG